MQNLISGQCTCTYNNASNKMVDEEIETTLIKYYCKYSRKSVIQTHLDQGITDSFG